MSGNMFDEEAFFMILDMYYASCEYCKYYMSNKENETCKNCIDKELWDFRRNFRMNMAYQFDVGEVMRICKLYHEYKNMVSDCVANNEIREALERYDASEKGLNRKEFMEELERW